MSRRPSDDPTATARECTGEDVAPFGMRARARGRVMAPADALRAAIAWAGTGRLPLRMSRAGRMFSPDYPNTRAPRRCGARTRAGGVCQAPAASWDGWTGEPLRNGRCRLHRGGSKG